jgi:plasmid stabilization system protein ParE
VTYRLEIQPDAITDIEEAAQWYEDREPGLGADFARSIFERIESLRTKPLIHLLRDRRRNVRWVLAHRFPYRIVYRMQNELVKVFAVVHTARHDRQWNKRV